MGNTRDLRSRPMIFRRRIPLTLIAVLTVLLAGYVSRAEPLPASSNGAALSAPSEPPATTPSAYAAESTPTASPESTVEPTQAPAPSSQAAASADPRSAPAYRIEIPRLGISLPVVEGDIIRDTINERTPNNFAFHLPGTSMFGTGNTYIYAHARVGMFLSLWDARVGDVVIARTPNGTREYTVSEVHPRVPPTQTSWAGPTDDTRLTLQTSTGPNSNDPRFVVVAR